MVNAHSAQNGESEFGPDPADVVNEQSKQIALRRRHESIEDMRIFADMEMGENLHRLPGDGSLS